MSPSDEAAIRRLLAEYCHHYDDSRPEEFAALFTEDAEFTVMGKTRKGRAEIRDRIGTRAPDQPPGQHVTYNEVIDIDGDTARAWTDFLYLKTLDGEVTISNAGRYHDRLVREPDRWRIARRTIVFLGEPVPEDA
jgi:uncharacterized protein (TIGR02246 family)